MIDPQALAQLFIEKHPMDAAKVLETLAPTRTSEFLLTVQDSAIVRIVNHLAADYAALCILSLPMDKKLSMFNQLDTQAAVDIFRYLTSKEKLSLLNQLPLRKRLAIQTLNKYNQNSVGAWMSTDYIAVREDTTIEEVIELIQGSELSNHDYLFVVNAKRQFISVVNTSQLLKAGLKAHISVVRKTSDAWLPARATIQEVAEHQAWKYFTLLPVIEHDKRLVGALSYHDLTTALHKSHIEFTASTTGLGEEALNLFLAVFRNYIQILYDFFAILVRKT
jgi:magnesium transporter